MAGLELLKGALQALVRDASAKSFSKYQRLLLFLRSAEFGWQIGDPADRLVIFSERIETLNCLQRQLTTDLQLKPASDWKSCMAAAG